MAADAFEQFKREILWDAAFEDWQGVWEPLWWLRGGGAIAGQTEADRQQFAERAMRELYADGLIYFVRDAWPVGNRSDPGRLTDDEVNETLRGDWWRGEGHLPSGVDLVCFGATPAGEAASRAQTYDRG